ELVNGPVKLVRTSACDNVDLTTTRTTELRGVTSRLYFELLHSIGGWTEVKSVECRICVCGAVEQEVVCIRTIAADADCGTLAGTPVQWTHIACLCAVRFMCSWNGEHQIDQHAAVERQVLHGCRLDHFADRSVSRS